MLFSGAASACTVPGFLHTGDHYTMLADGMVKVKLLKIDGSACWLMVEDEGGDHYWVNLNRITMIAEQTDK